MKKLICILLSVLMLLSLCACGAAEGGAAGGEATAAASGGQMQVGYGKVNITPDMSLPLSGYGNTEKRMSDGFMDYLYATCFAITDPDGNTAILFGIDMGGSGGALYTTAREKISKKYNIPMERIIISASHTHSAPDMGNAVPSVNKWSSKLIDLLVECADIAMADRAPADLYTTITETEGLNFVRRYKLEDGTINGYQSIITAV
jgi:hypothetical protein